MSIWEGARVLDQGLVDGQSRHLRRCEPAVLTSSECFEARFWKARNEGKAGLCGMPACYVEPWPV